MLPLLAQHTTHHHDPPAARCTQVLDSPRSCRAVLETPGVVEPVAGLHLLMDLLQ